MSNNLKTKLSREIQDLDMEMHMLSHEIRAVVKELNNDLNNETLKSKYNNLMRRHDELEIMYFEKCDKYKTL